MVSAECIYGRWRHQSFAQLPLPWPGHPCGPVRPAPARHARASGALPLVRSTPRFWTTAGCFWALGTITRWKKPGRNWEANFVDRKNMAKETWCWWERCWENWKFDGTFKVREHENSFQDCPRNKLNDSLFIFFYLEPSALPVIEFPVEK